MKSIIFKIFKLLCIIFFVILACRLLLYLFLPEPNIIQQISSPDGYYTAYLYKSNGGATTGWIYHISVLPSDKKLAKGNGNIYISDCAPKGIEWLNDKELFVDDYRSIGTTKRKQKVYGVTVSYNSIAMETN